MRENGTEEREKVTKLKTKKNILFKVESLVRKRAEERQ